MTSATSTDMVDDVGYVTSLTPDELDFMSKWMAEAFESGKLISQPKIISS